MGSAWHWLDASAELAAPGRAGVTAPAGFRAGSGTGGVKASGAPDVALVVADRDAAAAGVFTRNRVVAPCIPLNRDTLARCGGRIRAVVINAGNANACTGVPGMQAARQVQAEAARAAGCGADQVLTLSTGVIGVPLDVTAVGRGIAEAATGLADTAAAAHGAARAILTTDTRVKQGAIRLALDGAAAALGGMAKGSGMIHPNMATMLAVLTTDVQARPETLAALLRGAVDRSFHRITVDGDTSTNDAVLLLANGASGVSLDASESARACFAQALEALCVHLAQAIVRDGEGASRFVSIRVTGAPSEADAVVVGRSVATSPLVKTAFAGGDPNWGRILAAAGRSGVAFDPAASALGVLAPDGSVLWLVRGGARADFQEAAAAALFCREEVSLHLDLGAGEHGATVWTCDLTQDYVRINADYRT